MVLNAGDMTGDGKKDIAISNPRSRFRPMGAARHDLQLRRLVESRCVK